MKPISNSLWAKKASFFWFICIVSRQKKKKIRHCPSPLRRSLAASLAASSLLLQPVSFLSIWSIAVKMATGSGWQQYYCPAGQGKFSSSSASSMSFQPGIAMEYTQDLHLKMSKKIAQLTKVRSTVMGPISPLPEQCVPTLGLDPVPLVLVWELGTKLRKEFYLFRLLSLIVGRP